MKKLAVLLVRAYQLCLRPFTGNSCRFYPSCSEYAITALEKYGFFKGMWMTVRRLVRCNPWHPGGHDPVE